MHMPKIVFVSHFATKKIVPHVHVMFPRLQLPIMIYGIEYG
uniref:Uncharacterized protein n=1 Tax=Arundo donax TaxID=35708 RepID=A0A0A9ASZ5_ARUDO